MNAAALHWRIRLLALVSVWTFRLAAEPYVPKNNDEVLERVRVAATDVSARALRDLRLTLSVEPRNLELAGRLARLCIERGRADADPRYLGQAQAALAPWWSLSNPPAEALVLRATIRQSRHDFTGSLGDLDLALKSSPNNAQAWLTKATVLTVLGRYGEARRACLPLVQLAPGLVGVAAAANIACLNGAAGSGCRLLGGALERSPSAPVAERLWAATLLAEATARLGQSREAEAQFEKALALHQRDAYLLGAYADFLLDQQRPAEVASLLKDETSADGLLLRLALAEFRVAPASARFGRHAAALRERFEACRLRGDAVHLREEARFTLELSHDAQRALALAEADWAVQREPADVRILLECALAAGNPAAAEPALQFLRESRLEDAGLRELSGKLARLGQGRAGR